MLTQQTIWAKLAWPAWNRYERRLRAALRIMIQFGLWLLLTEAVAAAISVILGREGQMTGFAVRLATMVVSTWLAAHFIDKRLYKDFGLIIDRHWWTDLAFGLVLGGVLMTGIFTAEYSLGWITVQKQFAEADNGLRFSASLLGAFAVFIAVGISEELLTRGYQMRNMAEGFNIGARHPAGALLAAWLTSSAIFGFLHIFNPNTTWVSTLNLVLAGLFLGLGLVLTGRLGLSIGLHISWNFFQGNVFGFPVSGNDYSTVATVLAIRQGGPDMWTGGAFGPEAGLVGLSAILIGCLLIVVWVWARYKHVVLYRPYTVYSPPRPEQFLADDEYEAPDLPLDDDTVGTNV